MHSSKVLKMGNRKPKLATEYRCLVCEKRFDKFIIFEGHFTFNAKCRAKYGWLMQCYVCGEIFRHLAELKYHIQKHNISKPANSNSQHEESVQGFQCKICRRRFITKFYLNEHKAKHKKQTTKSFQTNGDISSKDISHEASSSSFQCKICNIRCNDKSDLDIHTNSHKQGKFNCEKCKLCFATEVSLGWHRQLFHPNGLPNILKENQSNQLQNVPSKVLKENQSNQQPQMGEVQEHNDTRNGEEITQKLQEEIIEHRCKLCKKNCYTHRQLKKHEQIHRGAFKCKRCNIPFTLHAYRWHKTHAHKLLPVKRRTKSKFQCDQCSFVGDNPISLGNHIRIHLGKFRCRICKALFTRSSLEIHERRYHPELRANKTISKEPQNGDKSGTKPKLQLHQCKVCKKKYYSTADLKRHEAIHRGAFLCKGCNIPFTLITLRVHQRNCKLFLQNKDSPSKIPLQNKDKSSTKRCKYCEIECTSHSRLVRHEAVHTIGEYKCKICQIRFTKNSLIAHEIRCHPELRRVNQTVTRTPERKASPKQQDEDEDRNGEKEFPCNTCDKVYTRADNLERHKRYHGNSTTKCKVCHIPYILQYLSWHEKRCDNSMRIKNTVTFKCKSCKIICNSQKNLERHMQLHSPGEYKCAICRKRFTRMAFASHKIRCKSDGETIKTPEPSPTVEQEIVYMCDKCDQSFNREYHLQTHMKSHLNRFSCKVCDEKFNDKIDLKDHTDKHIFECYVCEKGFSSLKYVKSHISKHFVIEQWVDPLNVYLSNWTPEKSREILQNQPLVLVENLNIDSINLADFGQEKKKLLKSVEIGIIATTELPCDTEDIHSNNAATELPCNIEEIVATELPPSIEESQRVTNYQKTDELPKLEKCERLPIHNEVNKKHQNPLKDNEVVYIPLDSEVLLESATVNQQPDTTVNVADYPSDGLIEISSESEDEEIDEIDMFHCYFCNKTFRTLNSLGIHSKKCSMAV